MELTDRVQAFILRHNMILPKEKVLVALSGGPDSVALLDVLYRLKTDLDIELHAAHLNHSLRGAESDEDARFAEELAQSMGIGCAVGIEDVKSFVKRTKVSTENGARILRYRFLQRAAEDVGASKIATGHNLNDQAETVLLRLLRGTGARGLGGIRPMRQSSIIRPLLSVERYQIKRYLSERGLSFREDSSNSDTNFARNKIRNELIPLLEEDYSRNILKILDRTGHILQDEDDFLDDVSQKVFEDVVENESKGKIFLNLARLLDYHVAVQRRIIRICLERLFEGEVGSDFESVEAVLLVAEGKKGKVDLPKGIGVQRSGGLLILKRGAIPPFRTRVNLPGQTSIAELGATLRTRIVPFAGQVQMYKYSDSYRAAFDVNSVGNCLEIRSPLPEDTMRPFGMHGHKKIKNLLIDEKIPRVLRDEVPILSDENGILWVVGVKIDETRRVSPQTQKVLEAEFQSPSCFEA